MGLAPHVRYSSSSWQRARYEIPVIMKTGRMLCPKDTSGTSDYLHPYSPKQTQLPVSNQRRSIYSLLKSSVSFTKLSSKQLLHISSGTFTTLFNTIIIIIIIISWIKAANPIRAMKNHFGWANPRRTTSLLVQNGCMERDMPTGDHTRSERTKFQITALWMVQTCQQYRSLHHRHNSE